MYQPTSRPNQTGGTKGPAMTSQRRLAYDRLERRMNHTPRHGVRVRRDPLRWLHSALRSTGDFLWGAFQPIANAV